ncbi:MAG TPA: hypothetical protein PKE29_16860 [Phycisphaerales bacterium]|nr:hypothetical protein [Phycisphaerales bacterium]
MLTLTARARVLAAAAVTAIPLVSGGCSGPSVWEQTFIPTPEGAGPALADGAPVRVRKVPWDRMQQTLAEIEREASATDVRPENWTPGQKAEAKARLLRSLQFDVAPEATTVLGRCEFRTTDTILPDGPDRAPIERQARRVGATDVMWSSRVLGRTEKIVDRPVTTFTTGSFWGSGRDRDRWWSNNYSETQTSWVPLRVPADDTGFVAFFLRADGR